MCVRTSNLLFVSVCVCVRPHSHTCPCIHSLVHTYFQGCCFCLLFYVYIYFHINIFVYLYIQWDSDLRKPHYMKNSEYETGFVDISVPFNEKIFKIRKRKSNMPSDSNPPRIHFVASRDGFVALSSFLTFM